jgi:hypothetical protein
MTPEQLLAGNGAAQIAFSSLMGWLMLVPRQPWGKRFTQLRSRDFTAAHLDWLMLAFMQLGASYLMTRHGFAHARWIAYALVFGGWVNPVPYVLRAFGINAFSLSGDAKQRASAALSGLSSLLITGAWIAIVIDWWCLPPG